MQNFNVELQRELMRNLTLEIRSIGTKGTKLYRAAGPRHGENLEVEFEIPLELGQVALSRSTRHQNWRP
jgi:hypothetical protein